MGIWIASIGFGLMFLFQPTDIRVPIEVQIDLVFEKYEECVMNALIGQVVVLKLIDTSGELEFRIKPREQLALCRNDAAFMRKFVMKELKLELEKLRTKEVE